MRLFGSAPTILLVEDEVLIRQEVADALTEKGFTVLQAGSADEVLAHVKETPAISILLTDIELRGKIDGLTLAKTVRETHPKIRVIFMSGSVLPVTSDDEDYLQKPYSIEELMEIINSR